MKFCLKVSQYSKTHAMTIFEGS